MTDQIEVFMEVQGKTILQLCHISRRGENDRVLLYLAEGDCLEIVSDGDDVALAPQRLTIRAVPPPLGDGVDNPPEPVV